MNPIEKRYSQKFHDRVLSCQGLKDTRDGVLSAQCILHFEKTTLQRLQFFLFVKMIGCKMCVSHN